MNHMPHQDWAAANRRRLDLRLEALAAALSGTERPDEPGAELEPPARLDSLAGLFDLNRVDTILLLLAVAQELNSQSLQGRRPNVALALQLGGEEVWTAICPQSPLRRWRMIELEGAGPLRDRGLKLDERILNHLLGIDYLDPRLDGLVAPAPEPPDLSAGEAELLEQLSPLWTCAPAAGWPVLQICGPGDDAKRAVAAALCAPRGQRLFQLSRSDIPRAAYERLALARLCDREMALMDGVLLVTGDGAEEEDRSAAAFIDLLLGPTIVAGRDPLSLTRNRRLRADTSPPAVAERRDLWRRTLGGRAQMLGEGLDQLAEQFTLDGAGVRAVADLAAETASSREGDLFVRLWDAARAQARRRLDDLAERIEAKVGWDDIVLPPDRLAQLADIAVHVRRAHQVHGRWGWAERGGRGLGVTALFAGSSGTGKTMAAEVLANDLRLDLYRVDLSQVVSKYIGETEKNLRRIFEAAEQSGAILLFDEADALFGKRSEVKDSHDRYANVEVSYLLQRMEAYRGLAILTTNLKSSLDSAFMRRLRFVIDFPFPDIGMRAEIWRRIFPADTPLKGDPSRMARLPVAGGTIRTIAINAAFLAAEAGDPVGVNHLAAAARREYAKLDKPITNAEFGGLA
ncbi:ATP-binding protein [Microvirga sp. BSC39]|uniref:ATP-binding protein n=1 Tax=Microvirga sp. BSC39 TaxID=1549810 RepID=UPI00055BB976|nr:ATP-binding protein [Microvirga sp. BSC39]